MRTLTSGTLTSARFRSRWRFGRITAIICFALLLLFVINQVSILFLIVPCNRSVHYGQHQSEENKITDYECHPREGIIGQGITLLSEMPAEWFTALASAFIALFTLTLWLATDRLWRISLLHARHLQRSVTAAAEQAQAARRHADIVERQGRPYLFYDNIRINDPINMQYFSRPHRDKDVWVLYEFVNYGQSPAVIHEHGATVYIGSDLPMIPQHHRYDTYRNRFAVGPGAPNKRTFSAICRRLLNRDLAHNLFLNRSGGGTNARFFFFAYVRYGGIEAPIEELGVCWEYLVDTKQFVPAEMLPFPGDIDAYNYRKPV